MRLRGAIVATIVALAAEAAAGPAGFGQVERHADTGVPARLWGEGVAVPGAIADADVALAAARAMLDAELALLAPGSKAAHWQLAANVVHARGAMRTVAFAQVVDGLPVDGGAIGFLFKRDRMFVVTSRAWPHVSVRVPGAPVDAAKARAAAIAWISSAYGGAPTVFAERGPSIHPIVRGPGAIAYRVVRTVTIDLAAPRGRWDVAIDAETGRPLARTSVLHAGNGTMRYETPVRGPQGPRAAFPAAFAELLLPGGPVTTREAGDFAYDGPGPAEVTATVVGPRVRVRDAAGPAATATATFTIPDLGAATWSAPADERVDAQLTAFVHANRAKAFIRAALDPDLAWVDAPLPISTNEPGPCNAFSGDDGLHFHVSGGDADCENTGRITDVVSHELAHALHKAARLPLGPFDPAQSEGLSDYFAATITGDPGFARGLHRAAPDEPLRDLDPPGRDAVFDADDTYAQLHAEGLALAGALWDLRTLMIARYGDVDGRARADDLYYAVLRRAPDIASAYLEALAFDDDDGDLANGTPHRCAIDDAFSRHGLVDPARDLGIGALRRDGHAFELRVVPPRACPETRVVAVELVWSTPVTDDRTPLARQGDAWLGALPVQPARTLVDYKVEVRLANGFVLTIPDNPGDPVLSFWTGGTRPLYCTDFESDPFAAGWTHGATAGEDEWQWGAPRSRPGAGDPTAATSGDRVVGIDLGQDSGDGLYPDGSRSFLRSPVIDTSGATGVRLQLQRWLNVEDGVFDTAAIAVDGVTRWENRRRTEGVTNVDTRDRQWRFFDLDLAADTADGSVQVEFSLAADTSLRFGGWTLDDVCIVADALPIECGGAGGGDCPPEEDDGGCCSTGGDPRGAVALALGVMLIARRRRKIARGGRAARLM